MPRPGSRATVVGAALTTVLLCAASVTVATGAVATVTPGPWTWPLHPQPRVIRGFAAPAGPFAPGHRGVDLAARVGQPVRSAGRGVVAFAGRVAGRGVVTVAHPDGRRTTYEPVSATVSAGQAVAAGTAVGTVSPAPGHCLPGTCLHWGLRQGETYRDPLRLVGVAAAVRLLPVWGAVVPARLRAGREGPRQGAGSPRGRCRRAPIAGRTRAPPRR